MSKTGHPLREAQFPEDGSPYAPRLPRGVRAHDIAICFPTNANLEYRWRYMDGTYSIWRSFPQGWQIAPPAAKEIGGIEWRPALVRRPSAPLRPVKTPSREAEAIEPDPQP